MKVQNINFCGAYSEAITRDYKNSIVMREYHRAKPFLKLLSIVLPDDKDIFVKIKNNSNNTEIAVNYIDKTTKQSYNLAKGTEYSLFGDGFYIMSGVFRALDKKEPKMFSKLAKNYLKHINMIYSIKHPTKYYKDNYIDLETGLIMEKKNS